MSEFTDDLQFAEDIDLTEEIGPQDYVFVVNPQGVMKTMLLPAEPEGDDVDPRIEELFKFFEKSQTDLSSAGHTLH